MYPDIREYMDEALFNTGYPHHADGVESKLFSSRTESVINLHFSWAEEYGIDCLALQRFYSETVPERTKNYNTSHLSLVKNAAEKHNRMFYIMYDFSGAARHGDAIIKGCSTDWQIHVEEAGLTESPNYACMGGKKIVCLWGLAGVPGEGRYPNANHALGLVEWFKNKAYYVIGGYPDNDWVYGEGDYAALYKSVDMASPWTVGRFSPGGANEWWQPVYEREINYCDKNNIDYMPVIYPGFAWCSFNGGKANMIPRKAGEFFWEQFAYLKKQGAEQLYLAMFDEYDEGTAFMKAAEDSTQIPMWGSYFQTLSVDGYWLSSDFYLRLAGEAGRVLKNEAPLTETQPAPHSKGPVYWRNGFEYRGYENLSTNEREMGQVDVCLYDDGLISGEASVEIVKKDIGSGKYALKITGSNGLYKVAKTKINCTKPLKLTWVSDTKHINAGVLLANGDIIVAACGKEFTAPCEICGILVYIREGEGYIDDMELREIQ